MLASQAASIALRRSFGEKRIGPAFDGVFGAGERSSLARVVRSLQVAA